MVKNKSRGVDMGLRPLCMAVGLVTFAVGYASAATVTFSDRSEFLLNAVSVFSEGFEGPPFGDRSAFGFGIVTLTSNPQTFSSTSRTAFPSLVSEGSSAIKLSERTALTLNFDTAIRSIGFDINELNSSSMDYADNAGNTVSDAVLANTLNSTFFGLISDTAFSAATLTFNGNNSSVVGFDNLQFGTGPKPSVIPLPGAVTLMISAISIFGLFRLTRQSPTKL